MEAIALHLPAGIEVRGELLDSMDPECLLQDILVVKLPSGLVIDVGWHPECDPHGSFRIVIFRDYWINQLESPVKATDPRTAALAVEKLARKYAWLPASSRSGEQHLEAAETPFQMQSRSDGHRDS